MDTRERYVGQILDRRYKIVKTIGHGGMATVFEAYDLLKNRPVALKMLKDDIAKDAQAVRRFINESKAVAMLSHPNIVSIYDVSVKSELKYIVMELIEGVTLKNYMQKKGALSFKEVVSITEQILRALEHAHSKGIVHRDIKPHNIMLLKNGTIKVADFGIAKLPDAETVTVTDKAIGTVFYISPEQASGKPIDARSDLYSLGATMYEMSTGALPFTAETPVSVALMQVKSIPKNPRELNSAIPRGLEQIILIAMEKNPAHRFQSASQMLRHLLQIKSNPKAVFKVTEHTADNENLVSKKTDNRKSKVQSRSMFPIIMGIVSAFLIVAAVSAFSVITTLLEATEGNEAIVIEIPQLTGGVFTEELEKQLEENHYNVEVNYVFDTVASANTIIDQEPKNGERRKIIPGKQNCDISLTISRGAQTFVLEDYKYFYYYEAEIALKKLGLIPKREYVYHDYIPESYVVASDPEPEATVKYGDTVTITISKGQNSEDYSVTVPDFTQPEATENAAKLLLAENELELGSVEYIKSTSPKGTILSQSIAPMSVVPKGTKISFKVSLGNDKPERPAVKDVFDDIFDNTDDTANIFEDDSDTEEE